MNRLRVLHVIPSVAPQRGGPSRAVVDMVTALNTTDVVEARILTTNDDGSGRLPVTRGGWVEHGGVPVWFLERYSPAFAPLREFALAAGLRTWLGQHAQTYDVIHVHALFSYLPSFSMAHARKTGLPYVVRPIGQLGDWSLAQSRLKKRAYLALLEQRNLQGAGCLHFTSELERNEANHLRLRPPAEVIPLGVFAPAPAVGEADAFMQRIGLSLDTPKILFLGRLHEKKGVEELFKAVALLDQPVQLLAAGTPVLVTRGVALAGLVEQQGLGQVCELETHSIARALAQALGEDALPSAHMRASIRRTTLQAFGWPDIAGRLVAMYQRLAKRGQPT